MTTSIPPDTKDETLSGESKSSSKNFHETKNVLHSSLCRLSFYLRGIDRPGVTRDIIKALSILKLRDPSCDIVVIDVCQTRVESMRCLYFLLSTTQSCVLQVLKTVNAISATHDFEVDYKVRSTVDNSVLHHPRHLMNTIRPIDKNLSLQTTLFNTKSHSCQLIKQQIALTLRIVLDSNQLSMLTFLCELMNRLKKWEVVPLSIRNETVSLATLAPPSINPDLRCAAACQNVEIRILLSTELSKAIRHLRLLWDNAQMVRFYRDLQSVCWRHHGECVIQQNEDLLCRPKTKSLIVFGLNETLVREEVLDELLREVKVDPKTIEESVRSIVPNDTTTTSTRDFGTDTTSVNSAPLSVTSPLASSTPTEVLDQEADPSRCRPTERHEIFEKKLNALEGHDIGCLQRALKRISLTENAFLVCRALTLLGYRLALMSQGLDFVANLVGKYLGFEYILCNKLEVDESGKTLTGRLAGGSGLMDAKFLVDPLRKIDWLQLLRDKLSIPRRNIIVVVDYKHADFLFQCCAMRIYFNALTHLNLIKVLLMLGLASQDIRQLQSHLRRQYGFLVDSSCLTLDKLHDNIGMSALSATDVKGWPYFPEAKNELTNTICPLPTLTSSSISTGNSIDVTLTTLENQPLGHTKQHFRSAHIYIYGDTRYEALPRLLESIDQCKDRDYKLITVQQVLMQQAFFLTFVVAWIDNENTREHSESSSSPMNSMLVYNDALKNLVFEATILGLEIKFDVKSSDRDNDGQEIESSDSRIATFDVTLLQDPHLSIELLAAVFEKIAAQGFNIEEIIQLTDSTNRCLQCIQIRTSKIVPDELLKDQHRWEKYLLKTLKAELLGVCQDHGSDIAVQRRDVLRFCRRLVVFDMDSTLIQEEVIDELARCAGVEKEVAALTERAMNGELDFFQSLKARVKMLKGMSGSKLDEVEKLIHFTPGARRLCLLLRLLGFRLAVVSGGFTRFARCVRRELGLHHAFANNLEVDQETGLLTGEVVGPVVTPQRKAALLQMLAELERCSPEQVIAVGDGANDIAMLMKAGMGVAFCAKPKVQESAEFRINHRDLSSLLYLIGISNEAAQQMLIANRSCFTERRLGDEDRSDSEHNDESIRDEDGGTPIEDDLDASNNSSHRTNRRKQIRLFLDDDHDDQMYPLLYDFKDDWLVQTMTGLKHQNDG